ncbi:MAG TPA: hypothetical protein VMW79_07980 [Anaerolineae bacterium]|nr:hypothetical protein [Anaerolineae bacterium]
MSDQISTYAYRDIAENTTWLRAQAEYWNKVKNIDVSTIPGLLAAAADEIERLRAELANCQNGAEIQREMIDAMSRNYDAAHGGDAEPPLWVLECGSCGGTHWAEYTSPWGKKTCRDCGADDE